MNVETYLKEIIELIKLNLNKIENLRYNHTVYKEDNTPVTNADYFVEQLVWEYVDNKFDSITFISEESFKNSLNLSLNQYIAVLDPIDGTENFSSGLAEWGVSIGFWRNQEFLGGAIYLPELDLMLMTGDKICYKKSRIIGLSSSLNDELINQIKLNEQYRIMGCAVYNIYNVIMGSYAKFVNPKGVYVWDFLPGVMLALEHGCKVFINGEPFWGGFLNPEMLYKIEIVR